MKESMPNVGSRENILQSKHAVRFLLALYVLSIEKDNVVNPDDNSVKNTGNFGIDFEKKDETLDKNPPFYLYNKPQKMLAWRKEQEQDKKKNKFESTEGGGSPDESKPFEDGSVFLPSYVPYVYMENIPVPSIIKKPEILNKPTEQDLFDSERVANTTNALLSELLNEFRKKTGFFSEKSVAAGIFRNKIEARQKQIVEEIRLLPELREKYSNEIEENSGLLIKDDNLQKLHLNLSLIVYDLYQKGKLKDLLNLEKDSGVYYRHLVKNKNKGKELYQKIDQSPEPFTFIINLLYIFVHDKGEYFSLKSSEDVLSEMQSAENSDPYAEMMTEILRDNPKLIDMIKDLLNNLSK